MERIHRRTVQKKISLTQITMRVWSLTQSQTLWGVKSSGPWSNQSVLKEINPEYSLKGLMLKLKLQYLDHLMWTTNSLKKTLLLGKIEVRRKRGQQRMRWLDGITDAMNMNLGKLREMVVNRDSWHAAVHGVTNSWTQLGNWITM